MASAYLVTLDNTKGGYVLQRGADAVVVYADTTAQAKDMAKALFKADADIEWANATVTPIVAETTLIGWRAVIDLEDNNALGTHIIASYTAIGADTTDAIGTGLAASLVAKGVAGAAYVGASNVLTIVQTTDNMGDWFINAYFYPPSGSLYEDILVPITGFFGSITAAGAVGIARTTTLVDIFPKCYGKLRQV